MKYIIKKLLNKYKTPIFIYNKNKLLNNINKYKNIKIFYAIKANYNSYILKLINNLNIGFEVVSIGEIRRINKLNLNNKIIYSGVCKTYNNIKTALFYIKYINIESKEELKKIIIANTKIIQIFVKINLNIKVNTLEVIKTNLDKNKFGMKIKELIKCIKIIKKNKNIKIKGISIHLGSQIKNSFPFKLSLKKINKLINLIYLKHNIKTKIINLGGGIGINYLKKINTKKIIKNFSFKKKIYLEPGRSIVGNSCLTISKIEYIKKRNFINLAIIDIGMENIIRPVLYNSFHKIKLLFKNNSQVNYYDLVGPICESTDILKKNIKLSINKNRYICIYHTGAYCLSMRSIYNIKYKPKEFLYFNNKIKLIS
ncbi:diaminopimelate decarboxylase [Candidatus Vidania fulgoroideorum]